MGRNYRKNIYPNPGIAKDGALGYYLQQDATYSGMSVSEVIKMRLLQFYEGRVYGQASEGEGEQDAPPTPEPEQVLVRSRADANALAFLEND